MVATSKVTLSSIAKEIGVSLPTVSKVVNGHSDVAAETRQYVEDALRTAGYVRRRSEPETSSLIELVFYSIAPMWTLEVIQGVEDAASREGMSVVISRSGTDSALGEGWIQGVLRRKPAAVVMIFNEVDDESIALLRSRSIPFVIIDPAGDPPAGVPAVGSTHRAGGLQATRHLIELGHTRIGAITGPDFHMCSSARVDGFRHAMAEAGLAVREDWVVNGDFEETGGRLHGGAMLDDEERPTAIFAGSDFQALGVIQAAQARGLDVPRDLSVVGYDDIALASWVTPALTTIHQPLRRMAERATEMVLGMARGKTVKVEQIDLATHLVVRDTTAPPCC